MYDKYTITHERGTTLEIPVEIKDQDGEPYAFAASDVVLLAIRPEGGGEPALTKTVSGSEGTDGSITIILAPADTAALAPGLYEYGVYIKNGTGFWPILPAEYQPALYQLTDNVGAVGMTEA